MKNLLLALIMILVTLGCGYFTSGTWDDDPDNWERAFYSSKPDDVVVLHSRYVRFPHWTDEFVYFFQIEQNDYLLNQILKENDLVKIDTSDYQKLIQVVGDESPDWFLPGNINYYEIWGNKEFDLNNFLVFLENENKTIFLFNRQF